MLNEHVKYVQNYVAMAKTIIGVTSAIDKKKTADSDLVSCVGPVVVRGGSDQLLYHLVDIVIVFLQERAIQIPVSEPHLDQLIHGTGGGWDWGRLRRNVGHRDPRAPWRYKVPGGRSPFSVGGCPLVCRRSPCGLWGDILQNIVKIKYNKRHTD